MLPKFESKNKMEYAMFSIVSLSHSNGYKYLKFYGKKLSNFVEISNALCYTETQDNLQLSPI